MSRRTREPPSIDLLRRLFDYDAGTGELVRRARSGNGKKGARIRSVDVHGYVSVCVNHYKEKGHRVAWAIYYGAWPDFDLDHANGIKADNRLENLRYATRSQNTNNRGPTSNNTSGYKGVSFDKYTGRWTARIVVDQKQLNLGRFDTPEDAARAYADAAKQVHGEFFNVGAK